MKRVLIIRGGAIGDFVLALPIFEAVRLRYPGAEVEVLGYAGIADLAIGRRHADRMQRVDGSEWAGLFAPGGELADPERRYLASFDRVFCIWPDADGTIRQNLLRAGARDVVSVDPVPPEDKMVHAVDHMAEQCRRQGLPVEYLEPHLYPSERDRWWAERYMRVTTAGERPLLGLAPGSGSPRKNWPVTGYIEIARHWIRRQGNVLVIGGPADVEPICAMQAALPEETAFFMCDETLPRVAATIERCEAFVGNDSGITHIAAAVRTPTVAIFGPTNPQIWQPRAPRVRVLQAPGPSHDLAALKPQQVIEAIGSLIGGR